MSSFKEMNLDRVEGCLGDWTDGDFFEEIDSGELTEEETLKLYHQSLLDELEVFEGRLLKHLDRMRYYHETPSWEDVDFLHREIQRIRKEFA